MAGYKINIQKSVTFWYTNNECVENEIRKMSLGLNLQDKWMTLCLNPGSNSTTNSLQTRL
jgi:hypothetical protein